MILLDYLFGGGLLAIFIGLVILSLIVSRWITNRKINNNAIKGEGIVIIVNSLILVINMLGLALSGWYTILFYL
ncbi:MAG: hypothetical protein ACLSV2_11680 [Clostridium sp.]